MNSSATLTGCDDIIKRLREAIAAGPTPGPWTVTEYEGCWYVDVPEDRAAIYHGDGVAGSNTFHQDNGHKANMQFIAAASPDNIAALLDRLDKAERENERLRAALDIARDYVAANVAYLRQRYRGREQFGRVHEAEGDLAAIDAATAAESGKE